MSSPFRKGGAGWIENIGGRYAAYNKSLTPLSGNLKQRITDAERLLLSNMRGKQFKDLHQDHRINPCIVNYAPPAIR